MSLHPFFNKNLQEISEEELYKQYAELQKKLIMANRLGYAGVAQQVGMILQTYVEEKNRRNEEMLAKMLDKNRGKGLDDYVKIE